jgi:hypothetical protein
VPQVDASLVSIEDVQQAYEETIPDAATDRVQWLVDYAQARLVRRRPSLRADLAAGTVDLVLVNGTLVSAILRVLRHPGAYASETAGEFSYTLDRTAASALLSFTQDELDDCTPLPVSTVRPAGVGSIRLAVPDWLPDWRRP